MSEHFRVLSPGFDYAAGDGRAFATQGQVITDAPLHGTGRCAKDCVMRGDHDWLLTGGGGAPVLAQVGFSETLAEPTVAEAHAGEAVSIKKKGGR